MGRVWRPVRFFAEEDGKQKPTLLFLIFAVLIGIGAWAGGILIWRDVKSQRYADSILTRTPTATATITPTATVTLTPTITLTPSVVPSSTPYVYSDPATWELVQKTDPNGVEYMDLQDWQKEQVWHFFAGFWELYFHNETGWPEWEVVNAYICERAVEVAEQDYRLVIEYGSYVTLDIPSENLSKVIHVEDTNNERLVRVVLLSGGAFYGSTRNIQTGEVIEKGSMAHSTIQFELKYLNNEWKISNIEFH